MAVLAFISATVTVAAPAAQAAPSNYWPYQIIAWHSQKCLDVAYASLAHGADVVQGDCWGGLNQQWYLRPAFVGSVPVGYEIVALHSGKCLDVMNASTSHGADVIQGDCSWPGLNQNWSLRPFGTTGYYEIVALHSMKCLDVMNASKEHLANVLQATCVTSANQLWKFVAG